MPGSQSFATIIQAVTSVLGFASLLLLLIGTLAATFFRDGPVWAKVLALLVIVVGAAPLTWLVLTAPSEVLRVDAVPVVYGFTPRPSGGPRPGCGCGVSDIVFPGAPYNGKAGEEFTFNYDAAPICVGQGFEGFTGYISWDGGQSTPLPWNYKNNEYPGIVGAFRVKYSKPGTYNVLARLSLTCIDEGAAHCRNVCAASGSSTVTIR
jgi:hypothetical protein